MDPNYLRTNAAIVKAVSQRRAVDDECQATFKHFGEFLWRVTYEARWAGHAHWLVMAVPEELDEDNRTGTLQHAHSNRDC